MMKKENIVRLGEAFERLILKMQEVDDFCVQLTKDISHADLSLIGFIGRNGEVIMRQVAEQCDVPLSTATWCVDKLVEKKYLHRFHSQEDRRIVKVALTKKGIGVFQLFQRKKLEMAQRMLEDISPEKQEFLIETLEQVALNLQSRLQAEES